LRGEKNEHLGKREKHRRCALGATYFWGEKGEPTIARKKLLERGSTKRLSAQQTGKKMEGEVGPKTLNRREKREGHYGGSRDSTQKGGGLQIKEIVKEKASFCLIGEEEMLKQQMGKNKGKGGKGGAGDPALENRLSRGSPSNFSLDNSRGGKGNP